jgi:hypothetical protein
MKNAEIGRLYNLEQLEHEFSRLPQKFLKGPDVVTASAVELPALTPSNKLVPRMNFGGISIPLQLTQESLPGTKNLSFEEFIINYCGLCRFNLRSRLAQLGLTLSLRNHDFGSGLGSDIYRQSKQGKNFTIEIEAYFDNLSNRPLFIPKNYSLGRFIHNAAPLLSGKALETAFQEKRIQIGNIPFDQLEKVFRRYSFDKITSEIFGIKIPINPDAWRWIPRHPQNEPIDVSKLHTDYRKDIESLQVPYNKDNKPDGPALLIGRTLYPITINDPKITGWIDRRLPIKEPRPYDEVGWQLYSTVFDGGTSKEGSRRTDWPAIVEHFCGYSKIINGKLEKDVEFFFYEDQE